MSDSIPVKGRKGATSYLEVNGSGSPESPFRVVVDAKVEDSNAAPVNFYFSIIKGPPTTLAANLNVGDYVFNVVDATGCTPGDYVGIFNADDENDNRAYFATIVSVSSNQITVDVPVDFDFNSGDTFACFNRQFADASGSPSSPTIYDIEVGENANQSVDITRLVFTLQTATAPELGDFGDITNGLVNGLLIRKVNGDTRNYMTLHDNGEISDAAAGDVTTFETGGFFGGVEGFSARITFNGPSKRGVAIRLDPGDRLEAVVLDDLTSLTSFRIVAHGHYVE